MVDVFAPSLHGDGIRFAFFHHLWNKNRVHEKEYGNGCRATHRKNDCNIQLRLPDTVIFRLGQPLQWYFTSERGGQASILRKRKQNVNVEKVEEVFLKKMKSDKGWLDSHNDIVAYFISSKECSSRKRISDSGSKEKCNFGNDDEFPDEESAQGNSCDIEYFNEDGLRNFLYRDRKNQTGILQRFVDPAGGGTNNSQIRAICTPKMCVLERRKTKQSLHDTRYGLYERAVTFEGPEVFSTSLPIRGAALPSQLRNLCDKALSDVSSAMMNSSRKSEIRDDLRMVLNLKVDSKERVWILYSSSIRLLPGKSEIISDIPLLKSSSSRVNDPLNIQDVITLSPSVKLCQNANHDPCAKISNKKTFNTCPSCGTMDVGETFHPVPYKTVISHFEQVMAMSEEADSWPPPPNIVKSAGGVGFGTVGIVEEGAIKDEDLVIPPVIRHLHQRLKVQGYRRYRSDPLFLHKQCDVCEDCFLAYAKLVSTSFQITRPIKTDTELERLGFASLDGKNSLSRNSSTLSRKQKHPEREKISSSLFDLSVQCPFLPKAIVDPPLHEPESDATKFMPLPYECIESPHQPLIHMIKMHQKTLPKSTAKKQPKVKLNPYEIQMKIVDTSRHRKKRGKNIRIDSISTELEETTGGSQLKKNTHRTQMNRFDAIGADFLSQAATKLRINE